MIDTLLNTDIRLLCQRYRMHQLGVAGGCQPSATAVFRTCAGHEIRGRLPRVVDHPVEKGRQPSSERRLKKIGTHSGRPLALTNDAVHQLTSGGETAVPGELFKMSDVPRLVVAAVVARSMCGVQSRIHYYDCLTRKDARWLAEILLNATTPAAGRTIVAIQSERWGRILYTYEEGVDARFDGPDDQSAPGA